MKVEQEQEHKASVKKSVTKKDQFTMFGEAFRCKNLNRCPHSAVS